MTQTTGQHPVLDPAKSAATSPASSGTPQQPAAPRRREPLWRHMLGAELRALRHERGETITGTARRAGLSPQYLSEVERGVKEPSSEVIAALADALEVTLLDLTRAVADELCLAQAGGSRGAGCTATFALAA